jgi:hypothetical protein
MAAVGRDESWNSKWFESLDYARQSLHDWSKELERSETALLAGGHASFGVCGTDPGRCHGAVFTRLRRRTPSWTNQEVKLGKAQGIRKLTLNRDQFLLVGQRIATVVRIRVSGERQRIR